MYGEQLTIIDSEEVAYILGLMLADGYLKSGSLALQEDDKEILEKVSLWLGSGPPYYIPPQKNRYSLKGQWKITFAKEKYHMFNHLGEDKSKIPEMANHLVHHFIRGIFDGDGCISIEKRYITKYPGKAIPASFQILFNKREHAEHVRDLLCKTLDLNLNKIIEKTGQGKIVIYKIVWSGTNSIVKIRDWLYKDATMYLTRKKIKFDMVKVGDPIAAAKAGAKANSLKNRSKYITWKCKTCLKEVCTSPSRIKIYCSPECLWSRSKKQFLDDNPGIKLEP